MHSLRSARQSKTPSSLTASMWPFVDAAISIFRPSQTVGEAYNRAFTRVSHRTSEKVFVYLRRKPSSLATTISPPSKAIGVAATGTSMFRCCFALKNVICRKLLMTGSCFHSQPAGERAPFNRIARPGRTNPALAGRRPTQESAVRNRIIGRQ